MIIDQLPVLPLPIQATDEIPIERGQLTYKAAASDVIVGGLRLSFAHGVSFSGTFTLLLTGLTPDFVVADWGLFWDSAQTDPIPENSPPCDITITTGTDQFELKIENFTSSFYIRPTFVKG